MTSAAQATTNHKNEQGKAASGLSPDFVVLSYENQADFEGLAQRLRADLVPTGEHESFLVNHMIQSRWRITRITRLESAAFEYMIFGAADATPEDHIVARMYEKGGDPLAALQRYLASIERGYHKCYRELLNGRQVNLKMQVKATDNYIKNVIFAPLPGQAPPTGFASQTGPAPQNTSAPQNPAALRV